MRAFQDERYTACVCVRCLGPVQGPELSVDHVRMEQRAISAADDLVFPALVVRGQRLLCPACGTEVRGLAVLGSVAEMLSRYRAHRDGASEAP